MVCFFVINKKSKVEVVDNAVQKLENAMQLNTYIYKPEQRRVYKMYNALMPTLAQAETWLV